MSFLAFGSPEYSWKDKLKKLDSQAYIQFRERVSSDTREKLPMSVASFDDPKEHIYLHDMLMDAEEIDAWNAVGVEIHVRRVKGLASNAQELHKTVFQVSVANVGLMQVLRVDVMEDACTDELQRALDRGWRILAVCPPNDARRPSYVIGHTNRDGHE